MDVADADMPDPSPLFWDHFAVRVRRATDGAAPVASWWSSRRLAWMMGAAAALVLTAGLLWRAAPEADVTLADAVPAGISLGSGVGFDDVAGLLAVMPADEVEAFTPPGGATWAMVDDLTDDERVAFVQLIEQQMEVLP